MSGPLTGVTVLEIAAIGPSPFCGMMLADMGADVIRIDRKPAGIQTSLDSIKQNDGVVDRGRRSICLDLKQPAAVEAALRLVEKADVLIEGFRPGVAEKLGLGPQTCLSRNPRLVYGRMTGWGQYGPLAQAAGHDLNYIALAGALHPIGPKDRPPPVPMNLIGDYGGGGMFLAYGVVCALLEAKNSGKGQIVDAAMTDGVATLMAMIYGLHGKGHWDNDRESNFLDGAAPFYNVYECADGKYISIGSAETQFYQLLLQKCEIQDPHFLDQWAKPEWPELRAKFAAVFKTRTRDKWCAILEGTDACFAPVLDLDEAPRHPHNVARGTFIEVGGEIQPAPAPRLSRTPGDIRNWKPRTGGHTRELLCWAGYSETDVNNILASGLAFQDDELNPTPS